MLDDKIELPDLFSLLAGSCNLEELLWCNTEGRAATGVESPGKERICNTVGSQLLV